MPELPEVETIARDLVEQGLVGLKIRQVRVFWPRTVAFPELKRFKAQLTGQSIMNVGRRAKYLIWFLDKDLSLWIHLRMTGKLLWSDPQSERTNHEHILLDFDDGRQLRYMDTRKFGRWSLLDNPEKIAAKLGPEPLSVDFTVDLFRDRIKAHKGMLKALLLNQSFLAGLGNIYVDEALWLAQLHPSLNAHALMDTDINRLHAAIVHVLEQGIAHFGSSLGDKNPNYFSVAGRRGTHQSHLKVFRRTGLPCPRCEQLIERIFVSQRSTHICRVCQVLPKVDS